MVFWGCFKIAFVVFPSHQNIAGRARGHGVAHQICCNGMGPSYTFFDTATASFCNSERTKHLGRQMSQRRRFHRHIDMHFSYLSSSKRFYCGGFTLFHRCFERFFLLSLMFKHLLSPNFCDCCMHRVSSLVVTLFTFQNTSNISMVLVSVELPVVARWLGKETTVATKDAGEETFCSMTL